MNRRPSASPASYTGTTLGWSRLAASRDSPQQPIAEALVLREALRQQLQRDRAPQPGVAREIYLAHAAAPDPGPHLIDADRGALECVSLAHRPAPVPGSSANPGVSPPPTKPSLRPR